MLRKSLFLTIAAALLVSCNPHDPVRVDTDVVDPKDYGSVYLAQAAHSPITVDVDLDKVQSTKVTVNAYLGGPKAYGEDITVEFEVRNDLVNAYNEEKNENHLSLSAEVISTSNATATIKAGELRSSDVEYTVDLADVTPNKTYLLPIAIKSCSFESVTENQTVCYFVINATAEIPDDPRTLVFDFGKKANGCILTAYSDMIFRDDDDNSDLKVYVRGDDGTYTYNATPGQGWCIGGAYLDPIIFVPPYTLCFRLNDTFQEFSFWDRYQNWQGAFIGQAGWTPASAIFGFKDIAFLAVFGDALNFYNIARTDNFDENHWVIVSGQGTLAESGWSGYKKYLCYKDHILTVDNDGIMYSWTLSDTLVLGERVTMEGGWEIYDHIAACEDDHLLCVDASGKVWRVPLDF